MTEPIRPAAPAPGPAFAAPVGFAPHLAGAPPASGYQVPVRPAAGYRPGILKPTGPDGRPLAEFWERLLAYMLDRLVISVIALIPTIILAIPILRRLGHSFRVSMETGTPLQLHDILIPYLELYAIILGFNLLVSFVYEGIYLASRGQTLGKRALKLIVVRVDGQRLGVGTTVLRWLMDTPLGFVPGYQWLDGLWQLWDQPYRQCLHDKVAKTVVVKVVP